MNSAFPPGHEYNGTEFGALFAMNCVELGSHLLLDCPFAVLNFALVFRSSVLHPNLKFILLCQSACIFVRGIARIPINIGRIALGDVATNGSWIYSASYLVPSYVRNFVVHVLVIERIMATLRSRTYEQWRSRWFSAGWLSVALITASINTYGNISAKGSSALNVVTYFLIIGLGFAEIFFFVCILQYNKYLYRTKLLTVQSLSSKYQLAENIRTSKQMIPCIFIHFLNIFYGSLGNICVYFQLLDTQFQYEFYLNHLFFASTSLLNFGIEVTMIQCHPFLKRDLLSLLRRTFGRFYNVARISPDNNGIVTIPGGSQQSQSLQSASAATVIVNVRGETLLANLAHDQLVEHHFRQLNEAWLSN